MLQIKNIKAEKGTKVKGFINAYENVGCMYYIPLMIINGSEKGPVLCLTGRVHGCEYDGIGAVQRIFRETYPKELGGAVMAVSPVDIAAFEKRNRWVNPVDGKILPSFTPKKEVTATDVRWFTYHQRLSAA